MGKRGSSGCVRATNLSLFPLSSPTSLLLETDPSFLLIFFHTTFGWNTRQISQCKFVKHDIPLFFAFHASGKMGKGKRFRWEVETIEIALTCSLTGRELDLAIRIASGSRMVKEKLGTDCHWRKSFGRPIIGANHLIILVLGHVAPGITRLSRSTGRRVCERLCTEDTDMRLPYM